MRLLSLATVLSLVAFHHLGAQTTTAIRICLMPATIEASSDGPAAGEAIRATFTTFLTGPSLTSQSLQARLVTQAREEARQAGCPFVLLSTLKVVTKRSGGGLLGRVAAGAVLQGATEAGIASGSTTGRIVGAAAVAGMHQATYNYATSIRTRDEVTLGYRLEAADGTVLLEQQDRRTAKADGEDLLTPIIQPAAEKIVEAARRKTP